MLGLRSEIGAALENGGADQRCTTACIDLAQQQKGEDAAQQDVHRQMQFHEIRQPIGAKEIGEEYGDGGRRIKDLCVDVCEERQAAVGIRIPERELSRAPRGCDEGGERQVIVAKIPRNHVVRRKDHLAVEDQDFRQQDQQGENPIFHSSSIYQHRGARTHACRVHTRVNAWCSQECEHGTQECVRYKLR